MSDISSDPVCPECNMPLMLGRHRWVNDGCAVSRRERGISSDPVDEIEFTDYDKVGGPKRHRRKRDISSDPVPHVHKPEYPSRCTGCEHLGWKDRDISSVTGSDRSSKCSEEHNLTHALYEDDCACCTAMLARERAATQREAVVGVLLDIERYTGLVGSNIDGVRRRINALLEGKTDE